MDDKTIKKLDFLLSKMIKSDFMVTANDLINNGFYDGIEINEIEEDFKYIQSIFKDLDVAETISTQDAEFINPSHKSYLFSKDGGFKIYYDKLDKLSKQDLAEKDLQTQINKLTKVNLELQNNDLDKKILYSIFSFIAGAILTNIKDIIELIKSLLTQ